MTEPEDTRCLALCEDILATIEMIREARGHIEEVSDRILARCDRMLAKLERSEQKWRRREAVRRRRAARRQRQLGSTASTRATALCGSAESSSVPSKRLGG